MKVTVLRKAPFLKKLPESKAILEDDFEILVLYKRFLTKKDRLDYGELKVSLDFKEFYRSFPIMRYFPQKALLKIASRHGLDLENEVLGVVVDYLDKEIEEILTSLALEVRYMTVYTNLPKEKFEFLLENAGIFPKFEKFTSKCEKLTVFLGDEFLIKVSPNGNTYYDISLVLPHFLNKKNLPEGQMIFSEYMRLNPLLRKNVKIRELMSK